MASYRLEKKEKPKPVEPVEPEEPETPTITCPEDAKVDGDTCSCNDTSKTYDEVTKTCK